MTDFDPVDELERRCASADLIIKEYTDHIEEQDGSIYRQHYGWGIASATGEFPEEAHIHDQSEVEFALSTSFERFRPIPGYEAMWSASEGIIEAEVVLRPPISLFRHEHAFSELLRRLDFPVPSNTPQSVVIPFPNEPGEPTVTLRFASPELQVWRTTSPAIHRINEDDLIPCLRVEGLHLRSPADAKERIEAIGNGALLGLDRFAGIAARLRTHYPWKIHFEPSRPKAVLQRIKSTPEVVPVNLYMHARLGTANLSAQFLGFYQVLEYFFPRCSISAEIKRLRAEITNDSPSFADITDTNLRLILERTRLNRSLGVGSELEQFQHMLCATIEAADLRKFISEDERLHEFYVKPVSPIVSERIGVEDHNRDLRKDAAKRLYKIRCRIVHTKEDSDDDVFIPFAAEVAELRADLKLIRFLAQRALWAFAHPLR